MSGGVLGDVYHPFLRLVPDRAPRSIDAIEFLHCRESIVPELRRFSRRRASAFAYRSARERGAVERRKSGKGPDGQKEKRRLREPQDKKGDEREGKSGEMLNEGDA